MRLGELFETIVRFGGDRDPRRHLPRNPFPDSGIIYGDPSTEVRTLLVGIDIEVAELLIADRLRTSCGVDAVIAPHPEGAYFARLSEVMQLQVDVLAKQGLPPRVAQEMLDERMREVSRRLLPSNHMRAADAAALLDMPFVCAHTPADNHVFSFLTRLLTRRAPKRLADIIDILMELPEYRDASGYHAAPRILRGAPRQPAGKIFVDMTGGTEGPKDVFDTLYKKGVRTLVCMHLSEDHFTRVKDTHLNVIIAGHVSSDTLGVNLLLDRIMQKEALKVLSCSGFRRFHHT